MTVAETIDVRQLLRDSASSEAEDALALEQAICSRQITEVRQEIAVLQSEIEAGERLSDSQLVRVGIGLFLLGQHAQADEILARVSNHAVGSFHRAMVLMSLGRFADADREFENAGRLGYDPIECTLRRAGAIRSLGRLEDAEAMLRGISAEAARRAEYSFQMGCILADQGETYGAIEYFERAVDMEPHHSQALFRLAAENSNRGNDDEAIRLYEQSLSKPPHYQGALLNLGLLYEDRENYSTAAYCFRRILEVDPTHERAFLYLKDIEATDVMYYDEDSLRSEARLEQLLSRPIADFELSVRSRNCLQGMDIDTLGDLTRISEQDLLGGKNFGETSLYEIREVMAAHGLFIGQNLHHGVAGAETLFQQAFPPEEHSSVNKPISELKLSVRARKCMSRLGLTTLDELLRRTADELLSSRNFGVTSLNEIRSKLSELDLKLRND